MCMVLREFYALGTWTSPGPFCCGFACPKYGRVADGTGVRGETSRERMRWCWQVEGERFCYCIRLGIVCSLLEGAG